VEYYVKSSGKPRKLGILPGSFNPPTVAHAELVSAAGFYVDEVLCVLPRRFPHKEYCGATLEQRLELLASADLCYPYSVAVADNGLFIDIASECRQHYPVSTKLYFICGRDAAERILAWDYGRAGVVEDMLRQFELLVAARQGEFRPPPQFRDRIHTLHVRTDYGDVSSTEVRERIRTGKPWEHLVPVEIVDRVRAIYS